MKVILDANIILAFLLTRGFIISSILDYWEHDAFTLLVSDEILEEYSLVLDRLVGLGKINRRSANSLFRKIDKKARKIPVITKVSTSPDKKDNRYLECAKDGKADYLVSRDGNHLLALKKYKY